MDKVKSFPGVFWILGLSVFLCSVSVLAFAADQPVPDKLMLSNAVFQEVEVVNADGKKEIKRVPADTALPGSELIYVITYKNSSDKPAEDVVINNPLAKELLYKDKSASGENAVVFVSVDGGKHYGDLAILRIPTTEGASRPAEVSDITDLQFKLSKQVLPQEEGTISFRASIR